MYERDLIFFFRILEMFKNKIYQTFEVWRRFGFVSLWIIILKEKSFLKDNGS